MPRTEGAARALREYVQKLPPHTRVAIDHAHRCTAGCKYAVLSHHHVAICTQSLHTHVCGRDACTVATQMSDTTYACPLTGLETAAPAEQRHVSLRSETSFNRSSQVHWSTTRRRVRVSADKLQRQTVRSTLTRLFASPARRGIYVEALAARDADVAATVLGGPARSYWTYVKVRRVVAAHAVFVRPPLDAVDVALVAYMCRTINLLKAEAKKRKLPLKKNDACIVFGLAQLFDTGFAPGGVVAIHPVPTIVAHGLSPCQYPKLPNLRARQQTIAVRQIQRICVDVAGRAALQLPAFTPLHP